MWTYILSTCQRAQSNYQGRLSRICTPNNITNEPNQAAQANHQELTLLITTSSLHNTEHKYQNEPNSRTQRTFSIPRISRKQPTNPSSFASSLAKAEQELRTKTRELEQAYERRQLAFSGTHRSLPWAEIATSRKRNRESREGTREIFEHEIFFPLVECCEMMMPVESDPDIRMLFSGLFGRGAERRGKNRGFGWVMRAPDWVALLVILCLSIQGRSS